MTDHRHRHWRRLAAACGLLALTLLVGPALPAEAGGPTSVLLANPATRQVSALGYDDDAYDRLAKLVDLHGQRSEGAGTPAASPDNADTDFTQQIRLTWMVHDTTVWRLDVIHQAADGTWLIETRQNSDFETNIWDVEPVLHRPQDPDALFALLRNVGLMETADEAYEGEGEGEGVSSPSPAVASDASAGSVEPAASSLGWGVIGVGAGVSLGLLGARLWRGQRGRGPRIVLRG